jgi:hypothetical protein
MRRWDVMFVASVINLPTGRPIALTEGTPMSEMF